MAPAGRDTTHYDILGLDASASADEIKARFRELARRYHPDVARTPDAAERFKEINEANRTLSDPSRRAAYDAELKLARIRRERNEPPARTRPPSPPRPRTETRPSSNASSPSPAARQSQPGNRRTAPHPASEGSEVDRLVLQAQMHFRRMKFREAERVCKLILRVDRRNAVAYEILGDIQRARGDTEQALAMYSYALQLDRANPELRNKFERIAKDGAAQATTHSTIHSRRFRRHRRSPQLSPQRVFVNAIGLGTVVFLLVMIHLRTNVPAFSHWIPEWDVVAIFSMAISGFIVGLLMGVNGLLGMVREEMAFASAGRSRRFVVPFGAVMLMSAMVWFYLAFLLYMARSFRQELVSQSIVRSFGACFAIVAAYSLCRSDTALYFLMSGGNIVYVAFVAGWAVADGFRSL